MRPIIQAMRTWNPAMWVSLSGLSLILALEGSAPLWSWIGVVTWAAIDICSVCVTYSRGPTNAKP
jgi:hypothetical protein